MSQQDIISVVMTANSSQLLWVAGRKEEDKKKKKEGSKELENSSWNLNVVLGSRKAALADTKGNQKSKRTQKMRNYSEKVSGTIFRFGIASYCQLTTQGDSPSPGAWWTLTPTIP